MGHVAEDLKKHRSWFGILFFYHSKLPTKFPQVSNARLHADCACRLADDPQQEHGCSCIATPPHDYTDEEITWCSTITAYLNALLGKQGRAERGLLAVGVHTSARTKAWQQAAGAAAGALRSPLDPQPDDQAEDLEVGGKREREVPIFEGSYCQHMPVCLTDSESMLVDRLLALLGVRIALRLKFGPGGGNLGLPETTCCGRMQSHRRGRRRRRNTVHLKPATFEGISHQATEMLITRTSCLEGWSP